VGIGRPWSGMSECEGIPEKLQL